MLGTIIPNFALFSYFTTDRFHYQLYGHLAPALEKDRRDKRVGAKTNERMEIKFCQILSRKIIQ